jgi:hypothetical protein
VIFMVSTLYFLPGTSGNALIDKAQLESPISEINEGLYDHVGFFATGGPGNYPLIETFQDETWIVKDDGTGETDSGQLYNNQYTSVSQVSQSGQAAVDVSTASAGSIDNGYSGLCTIQIKVVNDSAVDAQNSVFGFLDPSETAVAPNDVELQTFEIMPTGNAGGSFPGAEIWTQISGATTIGLIDRTAASGFGPILEHDWFLALSAKGLTAGTKNYAMYFQTELL